LERIYRRIQDSIETKKLILKSDEVCESIMKAVDIVTEAYKNSGKVLLCGNGGSASDAQHIEGELVGRFQMERKPLSAIALTTSSATMTAISNDYGFDNVFSRQVQAYGQNGDVLIALSTSGKSPGILCAIKQANKSGLETIALLGMDGGECKKTAGFSIIVLSFVTARIQEAHIMIGHILCEMVESTLFREVNRDE